MIIEKEVFRAGKINKTHGVNGELNCNINADTIDKINAENITNANKVIGFFQAIGSIVSVLALVLIGIKYMMGSIEEKAEYKETMTYYIVGAILVFAISNISAMIYNFAKTLNN